MPTSKDRAPLQSSQSARLLQLHETCCAPNCTNMFIERQLNGGCETYYAPKPEQGDHQAILLPGQPRSEVYLTLQKQHEILFADFQALTQRYYGAQPAAGTCPPLVRCTLSSSRKASVCASSSVYLLYVPSIPGVRRCWMLCCSK